MSNSDGVCETPNRLNWCNYIYCGDCSAYMHLSAKEKDVFKTYNCPLRIKLKIETPEDEE